MAYDSEVVSTSPWAYLRTEATKEPIWVYAGLTMVFTSYFFTLHGILHTILTLTNQVYGDLNQVKRNEYRSYVVALIHHVFAIISAVLTMFYVCGDGKTTFNDLECLDKPRNLHILAMMHTQGYFITDTVFLALKGQNTTADYQMYVHHVISIINFYCTLIFFNFTVALGVELLFVEVGTFFVCIRWLLYTHNQGHSTPATINAVFIFIAFLFGRVLFQMVVIVGYGLPLLVRYFKTVTMSWLSFALILEMSFTLCLSLLMNVFWMGLIINQLYRVITRGSNGHDELEQQDKEAENEAKAGALITQTENLDQDEESSLLNKDNQESPRLRSSVPAVILPKNE